jgi:hypothetical protein
MLEVLQESAATQHCDPDAFSSCCICITFYCESSSLVGYEPVYTDTQTYDAGSVHIDIQFSILNQQNA